MTKSAIINSVIFVTIGVSLVMAYKKDRKEVKKLIAINQQFMENHTKKRKLFKR